MKKYYLLIVILLICSFKYAIADNVHVKLRNGTVLTGNIISLDPASEIVLNIAGYDTTIKMNDIENIESVNTTTNCNSQNPSSVPNIKINPGKHPAITCDGIYKVDKKGKKRIEVPVESSPTIVMELISDVDKTLTVVGALQTRFDYDSYFYHNDKLIIPEYVTIDSEIYSVRSINPKAFVVSDFIPVEEIKLKEIILPSTLKSIGNEAFCGIVSLNDIIIPDSVEEIGKAAFRKCGSQNKIFGQLYIPETVKMIGENAFRNVGENTSYRGYFQGNLTSIPSFITVGNCTGYGIDEEAIEEYNRRNDN